MQRDLFAPPPALELSPESRRLATLQQEHDKLLRRVQETGETAAKLRREMSEGMEDVVRVLESRMVAVHGLQEELRAVMDALAADGRRSRRARTAIREARVYLEREGFLSEVSVRAGPGADPPEREPYALEEEEQDEPEQVSAERPVNRAEIKGVFRRLAAAVHPDRAQDDETRARHTAAMKEVTAAYHDGDFARLLELEKALGVGLPQGGQDPQARVAALERLNKELRRQLRILQTEVRRTRRTPEYAALREARTPAGRARMQQEADAEVKQMRTLVEFVTAFRDGKISVAQFEAGPAADAASVAESLDAFAREMEAMFAAEKPSPRPRKKKGRR